MHPVLWLLLLAVLGGNVVSAHAKDQICSGWGSWLPKHVYGEMNIKYYAEDSQPCKLSLDGTSSGAYLPNKEYTVKVSMPSKMGVKLVVLGGAHFIFSSTGKLKSSYAGGKQDCVDYDSKITTAYATFRTPRAGGVLTLKALCGTEMVMHVAEDLTLQPADSVLPATVVKRSKDPKYEFQYPLMSTDAVVLKYTRNSTHLDVALEYNKQGYISFGMGRRMIGSTVLIGVNPSLNDMPAVGLYKISNKTKAGGNVLLASSVHTMVGIAAASYEELANGHSVLKFTQLATAAAADTIGGLVLDSKKTDVIWAVGPSKYGMHTACGTVLGMEFVASARAVKHAFRSSPTYSPLPIFSGGGEYEADTTMKAPENEEEEESAKEEGMGTGAGVLAVSAISAATCCGASAAIRRRNQANRLQASIEVQNVDDYMHGSSSRSNPSTFTTTTQHDGDSLEMSLLAPNMLASPRKLQQQQRGTVVTYSEFESSPNLQLFNGYVYDFTPFLDEHPGGAEIILQAGKDITAAFNDQGHSKQAIKMLKTYYIGALETKL